MQSFGTKNCHYKNNRNLAGRDLLGPLLKVKSMKLVLSVDLKASIEPDCLMSA